MNTDDKSKNKKNKKFGFYVLIHIGILLVLNLLARWEAFCDFYTDRVYRIFAYTYGRFMGIFPFSMGEILIGAVAVILAGGLLLAIAIIVALIIKKNGQGFKRFYKTYYKLIVVLVIITGYLMTLNCSIPYNCSRIVFKNEGEINITLSDAVTVRNYVATKLNTLSEEVERDSEGHVKLPDNYYKEIKRSLKSLSDDFPRMRGYYPNPKKMFGSFYMFQVGTIGVYFPFTLEANISSYLAPTYEPATIAHELSHLKGYMYEDEANFMAYLACINSDSKEIQYSGYMSVIAFLDNLCDTLGYDYEDAVSLSETVFDDDYYYTEEAYAKIIKKERKGPIISDETLVMVEENFTDAYMDYYDVTPNYKDVAGLIIRYYKGKLY